LGRVQNLPSDLFVIYSTEPGKEALEGEKGKRNSPFAEAFIQNMGSTEDISIVIRAIIRETMRLTNNRQMPDHDGRIISQDYFSLNPKGLQPSLGMVTVPDIVGMTQTQAVSVLTNAGLTIGTVTSTNDARVAAGIIISQSLTAWISVAPRTAVDLHVSSGPTPAKNYAESQYGIDMVYVQGGTFTMGCTREQGRDCQKNESPAHKVTLNDFYIGKYEVTQAQWKAVMGNNPSKKKGDNLPVENVSWNDVQEFIRLLNERTGGNYRLPTEAEWEYAARGGNQSKGYKYSGSDNIKIVAWYDRNSGGKTHPVGTKEANELGIHDMSGNVWEWVNDRPWFYGSNQQTNPQGSLGSHRVYRGGGLANFAKNMRVSVRGSKDAGKRSWSVGVRLAHSLK